MFIGGSYDNIGVLRLIASMVKELGYQPIIALDFDVRIEEVYSYDLRLLANCKYAIFEISFDAGHLAEIAKCQDFNVEALLVYQARDEKKEPPPSASQMALSSAHQRFGYIDFEELREYLSTFLPPERRAVSRILKIRYNDEGSQ